MKKIIMYGIGLFLFIYSTICLVDVALVLSGVTRYIVAEYGLPNWYESPIMGYSVSAFTNFLMLIMGLMSLIACFFYMGIAAARTK